MSNLYPDDASRLSAATQQSLQDLRVRAERRQLVTSSLPASTSTEVQRLMQELQVHHIELEMQYEELLLAQSELEISRAQYVDLYELAPIGYCTLDVTGTLLQLNLRASELLGTLRQRLMGRRLALFIAPAYRLEFSEFLRRVILTETKQSLTLEMRRADNTVFFARLEGTAVPDKPEQPQCRVALVDITKEYEAQRALTQSEKRFRTLFEQNQDSMLLLRDNRIVDCNASTLRQLGIVDKKVLLGQHASAYSPERQPNTQYSMLLANEHWQQAVQQGFCRFEWCRQRANGGEFWQDVLLVAVPEEEGMLVYATCRDITAQKRAAKQVQESEERLQEALSASATGIIEWDLAHQQVRWDARARQIFGWPTPEDLVPMATVLALIHPDDLTRLHVVLATGTNQPGPQETEYRVCWPDGTVRYVTSTGRTLAAAHGRTTHLPSLVRDVTDRRAAEEELEYKNRLLEHILANLPVFLGRIAPDGRFLELMGAGLRRIAVPDNQLVGKEITTTLLPWAEPLQRLLAGEQVTFIGKLEHQNEPVYFQHYGFFDAQRQQGIVFGIDVTEAENRREQLQRERDFSKSLLDNSVDAIMAFTVKDLRLIAWNATIAQIVKLPEQEALGGVVYERLPIMRNDAKFQESVRRAVAGETVRIHNWKGLHDADDYDLTVVPVSATPTQDANILITARNVTERNMLLAETARLKLREQQAVLSAILNTQEEERRRIAESLHNGVGQLLYATRLSLDMLPASEQVRNSLKLLDESIRTVRTISYELTPGILEDFGLPAALQELVRRIPPRSLTVALDCKKLGKPLPRNLQLAVYRIVQELLNNVMKHARARHARVQVSQATHQIVLEVEDDGCGFDPTQLTPGNGIGLANIRNRVELLGGTLNIQSVSGKGARVHLQLPLESPAAVSPPANE